MENILRTHSFANLIFFANTLHHVSNFPFCFCFFCVQVKLSPRFSCSCFSPVFQLSHWHVAVTVWKPVNSLGVPFDSSVVQKRYFTCAYGSLPVVLSRSACEIDLCMNLNIYGFSNCSSPRDINIHLDLPNFVLLLWLCFVQISFTFCSVNLNQYGILLYFILN